MNIFDYASPPWEVSIFKKIPMAFYNSQTLDEIRNSVNFPIRIKFRGPRPRKYGRGIIARQGTCLKEDAITFTGLS